MAFNSLSFLLFFSCFFIIYWFLLKDKTRSQNVLILIGSYVFYGFVDWRFVPFIFLISIINFIIGKAIGNTDNERRKSLFLTIGVIQGIGGLAFFKYTNFFLGFLNDVFQTFSLNLEFQPINILVPIGISFFTFRTVSYLIDIDRGKIEPCTNLITFLNFVSFFPSLISGPIDKAGKLIPQLENKREFDYENGKDALRQILWGMFKKVVIADNCALIANDIFGNYENLNGSTLFLGALFYTFQVYADFSGYTDMAIGFAKLIGFRIARNFDYPFFAENIPDFWRRWHISLTSWLTEYVFTPLSIAFRDYGKIGLILAILINLTLVGMWHGASWNNVLYGFVHGVYFIPLILLDRLNKRKKKGIKSSREKLIAFSNRVMTFMIVLLTFIIFRSLTVPDALRFYMELFSSSLFEMPTVAGNLSKILISSLFIIFLLVIEWFNRDKEFAISQLNRVGNKPLRISLYYILLFLIIYYSGHEQQFIYAQF